MTKKKSFVERYQENDTPWEINRPDHNLINFVSGLPVPVGTAVDLGCGTGDNCIWLATHGFQVTGCDLSDVALAKARDKAKQAKVTCTFHQGDFMVEAPPGSPFTFAFDRGCFHTFEVPAVWHRFASRVADILEEKGQWLSLIGNKDEDRGDREGPPQLSASQIIEAVEPFFEIISLTRGHFDFDRSPAPLIWICHMRKRTI